MAATAPLLCLDIGNSRLKALLVVGGASRARLALEGRTDPSAWDRRLAPLLTEPGTRAAFCSVAPSREPALLDWLRSRRVPVRQVSGEDEVPFPVAVESRATLGADRLCNAAAAWREGLAPALVIDAGSAVTADWLDAAGVYRGGLILPGRDMMLRALARGTERLPEVRPRWTEEPVGRDTASALAAGATWGLLAAAEGLAARLGAAEAVVLTGGLAPDLAARWRGTAPRLEPDWTLLGLRALVEAGAGRLRN
ncbi:MAG: type III pantothenate kinase [Candidatus Krumholzibacteriota bacterium]|nr:type III pantothenate kinase [Candidatus Krumholzibacteriota bacterium]